MNTVAVKAKMAKVLNLNVDEVDDGALLTDVVHDSLCLVELLIELQEDLGVRIVQEDLHEALTVDDLAAMFARRSEQGTR